MHFWTFPATKNKNLSTADYLLIYFPGTDYLFSNYSETSDSFCQFSETHFFLYKMYMAKYILSAFSHSAAICNHQLASVDIGDIDRFSISKLCCKALTIRYPGGGGGVYRIEKNNRALKFFEKKNCALIISEKIIMI